MSIRKTIEFNTGRQYSAEGQFISATLHDDGEVTFMDHSRSVDGQFTLGPNRPFTQGEILGRYDSGEARNTTRSWQDGLQRGGCNTR